MLLCTTYSTFPRRSPKAWTVSSGVMCGKLLYVVHNSTFDLAFHTWRDPLERVAALADARGIALATPEIGEVLTLNRPRENRRWWQGLR